MFKLIWKNLWARRRKNGWLLAELILVSIISWVVLDPVIVVTHDRNIPLGYDAERLCLISLGALQPQAPGYDAEAQDSATLVDNYYNLVRYVKDFDGVESATPVLGFCYPNSSGSSNSQLFAEGDTIPLSIMMIQFLPHTNFFDTYGFRSGKGRTPGQLSDYAYAPNDIVLTENAAEQLFHTKDAHGKRCVSRDHGDTLYMPVVGTIGAMKMYSEWRPVPVAFMPMLTIDTSYIPESAHILVRLKEGVSMERFLHDFRPWMVKEMRRGNLFARSVRSYEQIITESEASNSTPIYRRNLAMAAFFLVNLCLGVIGTFWLQTRTRREEVGSDAVVRSYTQRHCPPADGRRHGIDRGRFTDWFSALFAICTERRAGQRAELGGEHRELLGVGFHLALSARVARHLSDTAGGSVGGNLYPSAQHQPHSTYGSSA